MPNIPLATDELSDSQADIKGNFEQLDTSFGIDHYLFSNATSNNGFHNQVTQPLIVGSAHPTTAATNCRIYTMEDLASIGLLQYSRGPSDAIPTPLTAIQSANNVSIGTSPVDLIDFTGARVILARFMATDVNSGNYTVADIVYGNLALIQVINQQNSSLTVARKGSDPNILTLRAAIARTTVNWVLKFYRIQT